MVRIFEIARPEMEEFVDWVDMHIEGQKSSVQINRILNSSISARYRKLTSPTVYQISINKTMKQMIRQTFRIYPNKEMDRDLNAAINIRHLGIDKFNTAGTAEINACGDMRRSCDRSAQEAARSVDQQ